MNQRALSQPETLRRSKDGATFAFPSREAAWAFLRACDDAGISTGFPSLASHDVRTPNARTVEVGIRTWMDREVIDTFAARHGGAMVPGSYHFKGEKVTL